ncbi:hypothetical protein [Paraburkholderia solisilvae]|uniref:Uncharacterized protein n=1 Tax=Paraburkholderia solisilvae TaxID=624376 RepID=A0A6J5ET18_9BURK|nr:hypothetical protein [Paraburkholderia solisilvae]CAB3769719.1 hypothetical protein LMG29739_05609 [Paraburkholderia solisilvae]
MDLTSWIIILAIAWIAVAFFCLRTRTDWSIENRARRRTGTRLLAQAVFALWSAALIVLRGFELAGGKLHLSSIVLSVAALLAGCGCYWLIRGMKFLKARRLFAAY